MIPPVNYKGCICTSPESIIYLRGDSIENKHLQENIPSSDFPFDKNESENSHNDTNQAKFSLYHSFIESKNEKDQM